MMMRLRRDLEGRLVGGGVEKIGVAKGGDC